MKTLFAAAMVASLTAPALADEAWVSNAGTVIYLEDVGTTAVLQQFHPRYGELRVYVPGLGGNYDDRVGLFAGYWIAVDPSRADWSCDVSVVMEDGHVSNVWGRVNIEFMTTGFPSGFDGFTGSCHDEADVRWTANPS